MKRLLTRIKRYAANSENGSNAGGEGTQDGASRPRMTHGTCEDRGPGLALTPGTREGGQRGHLNLDDLPPEVRRHLLSILDLSQLKALVHSSPTFHAQYAFDRRYLLGRSLEQTLRSATVDAYAVYLLETRASTSKENLHEFLRTYSEDARLRFHPRVEELTQDEAVGMTFFYFRYVRPTMEHFTPWARDNLAKTSPLSLQDSDQDIALTRTETLRLSRAIYRFQILCNLADPTNWAMRSSREQMVEKLFEILEPWEIEEVFCLYQFSWSVYDKVFKDIFWDVHPDNPKFDDQVRPPTPDGAFELDNQMNRSNLLEGTTLRGLSLLHTVLFRVRDHEHLVSTMQQHMVSSYIPLNTLEGLLGETQQALRRADHPSDRDRMQDERAPFPFRGDSEDAPPLAWTTIWGDTYSNLYGCYVSDEMRSWGYVFWDAATLEKTGGKRALEIQWSDYWDDDPREDLL